MSEFPMPQGQARGTWAFWKSLRHS